MVDDGNERVYHYLNLPEGAYEILERDSERLQKAFNTTAFWLRVHGRSGKTHARKRNLRWLLPLYAEEIKKQPPIPIKLMKTKRQRWRGRRAPRIGVALSKLAFDILRERARRKGYIRGNKGCISHMLQDHAWELRRRFQSPDFSDSDEIFLP